MFSDQIYVSDKLGIVISEYGGLSCVRGEARPQAWTRMADVSFLSRPDGNCRPRSSFIEKGSSHGSAGLELDLVHRSIGREYSVVGDMEI